MAGIRGTRDGAVGPIRVFLEPATSAAAWDAGSTSAVWSNKPVAANLAAVFRRRQLEAFRAGADGVPLRSPRPARLDDVLAFLDGQTDDEKLADLLWGLIGVNWAAVEPAKPDRSDGPVPPEFGLCRLVVASAAFGPRPRAWTRLGGPSSRTGPRTPSPTPKCSTPWPPNGRTRQSLAITTAAQRLRSGGLNAIGYRNRRMAGLRLEAESRICADRLLAGMLFPLSARDLVRVANAVLYPPEPEE